MEHPFKVGDQVVVIPEQVQEIVDIAVREKLLEDVTRRWTIRVVGHHYNSMPLVHLEGIAAQCYAKRFRLADPPKPKFEVRHHSNDQGSMRQMMKHIEFGYILRGISYPGFIFLLELKGEVPYLVIECPEGTCNVTGEPKSWRSRKWMLSYHMTKGEIVQTAFLAVRTALEHEAREKFKYVGQTPFNPHFDIDALVDISMRPESYEERA